MAISGLYLGSASDLASNMGSMFGSDATQGTNGGMPYTPPRPIAAPPERNQQPQPLVTGSGPAGAGLGTYNPMAPQAIRPTSFGNFDPSYGQNLATSIGQSFQRPQANQPLQFNPYGNLTDANVNYPNMGGGNAPSPGIPQTLLSWAQSMNPTALNPPTSPTGGAFQSYDVNGNPIFSTGQPS